MDCIKRTTNNLLHQPFAPLHFSALFSFIFASKTEEENKKSETKKKKKFHVLLQFKTESQGLRTVRLLPKDKTAEVQKEN